METVVHGARLWARALLLTSMLPGCYALDSATSACQRTPAYCASVVGEETVIPSVRGGAEIASLAGVYRLLTPDLQTRIEQDLVECAELAEAEVNRLRFGGHKPTRQQCQEVLPELDPCRRRVTRAMQLGTEKHDLALRCAHDKLSALRPGGFSLEPRYRYDREQRRRQLLSAQEVRTILQRDCGEDLKGTLKPDVVIHSGNALEVLAIYDFKFPCPSSNDPSWKTYLGGSQQGSSQGDLYAEGLDAPAALVSPGLGVRQRIFP